MAMSRRRRARVRYLDADRLKRHQAGIRRLDDVFGLAESGVSLAAPRKRGLLEALGFRGFDTKATDE